jgi:hypothetical protein
MSQPNPQGGASEPWNMKRIICFFRNHDWRPTRWYVGLADADCARCGKRWTAASNFEAKRKARAEGEK